MKNLMFSILLLSLSSCKLGNDGDKPIENPINDSLHELREEIQSIATSTDIKKGNPGLEQEKSKLYLQLWHPANKLQNIHQYIAFDTIIGEWRVSSLIQATLDPKEYVKYGQNTYYDINDSPVNYEVIYYGRKGRIVFELVDSINEMSDTVYINRDFLTKRLSFEEIQIEDWALLSLDFKEVRNDSIIFLTDLGIPDTDAGYIMELKFSLINPIGSLEVDDVTEKIWTYDEE